MTGELLAPEAWLHGPEGVALPTRYAPLPWQIRGLSFTASGYGRRIPSAHLVQLPGSPRWRRVYVCCFSNSGTAYVEGAKQANGRRAWTVVTN